MGEEETAAERSRLQAVARKVALAAGVLHGAPDQHEQAVVAFRRTASIDPYDEQAHRALVQALERCGRAGEARRERPRHRRRLQVELGVVS